MNSISVRIEKNNVVSKSTVRQEEINICGAKVLAVATSNAKCFFSPRHVCAALDINWKTQFRKIEADPVLSTCVVKMTTKIPGFIQSREYLMLPIEFLSGWLFTIKKVRPALQAKLNLYRAEGFLALDAWFRQELRSNPATLDQFDVPQTLAEALDFAAQQVRENQRLKKQNALMTPKASLFDVYMNTEGTLTLTEAGKVLGVSGKALGMELRHNYGWLFKREKGVIPTQHAIKRGWMIAIPINASIDGMPNCYGRITKKGLALLMESYTIEAA